MRIILPLCSAAMRFIIISATVLLLTACSGKDDIPLPDPKIYAGGYYHNGGPDVACYWDEGTCVPLSLPDDIRDSYCTSIVVSGGVIYAGGYYHNGTKNVACVWVNNSRTDLTAPGTSHAYCTSIAVYNGMVYAGGYYISGTKNIACYWRGNNRTDLSVPQDAGNSRCTSIVVDNGKVYAGGYHVITRVITPEPDYSATSWNEPCYWTNNVRTDLNYTVNPLVSTSCTYIALYKGNVYAAGNLSRLIWVWQDGKLTGIPALGLISLTFYYSTSIIVNNGNVYVGGYYMKDGLRHPCYWKDKSRVILSCTSEDPAEIMIGYNNSIAVYGGKVYSGGYYQFASGSPKSTACYWVNTSMVVLALPEGITDGVCNSICVVPQ